MRACHACAYAMHMQRAHAHMHGRGCERGRGVSVGVGVGMSAGVRLPNVLMAQVLVVTLLDAVARLDEGMLYELMRVDTLQRHLAHDA